MRFIMPVVLIPVVQISVALRSLFRFHFIYRSGVIRTFMDHVYILSANVDLMSIKPSHSKAVPEGTAQLEAIGF